MHISPQKYTEARKEGNRKWDTANLDRVSVAMPKGKKDIIKVECPIEALDLDILGFIDHNITVNVIIKAHAEAHSESVNGFINRAIDEAIERDESAPAAFEGQREG